MFYFHDHDKMVRVVMMVSVMVMVVAGAESTITSRKFKKFENIRAEGTVLISQEVRSSMECSAICIAMDCLDYTLTNNSHCTTYSSVTSITNDTGTHIFTAYRKLNGVCRDDSHCAAIPHAACVNYICNCVLPAYTDNKGSCMVFSIGVSCSSDEECLTAVNNTLCFNGICQCSYGLSPDLSNTTCQYSAAGKGEACLMNSQCTLTSYTVCYNETKGICVCASETLDEGDSCKALSFEDACNSTTQCLVGLKNSICDVTCRCPDSLIPVDNNTKCSHDHSGDGFIIVGGRWALFITFIVLTWNEALSGCKLKSDAQMFKPVNMDEWDLMKAKALHDNEAGNFFMPINDKNGELIWNNGSSAKGVSFLSWMNEEEGNKKTQSPPSNCGYVKRNSSIPSWDLQLVSCNEQLTSTIACELQIN